MNIKAETVRRNALPSMCLVLLVMALGTSLPGRSAQAQTGTLMPRLICNQYNPSDGTNNVQLTAVNTTGSEQFFLVGPNNAFAPGAPNQGQPNFYRVGTSDIFTVSYYPDTFPVLTWTLDGNTLSIGGANAIPSCSPIGSVSPSLITACVSRLTSVSRFVTDTSSCNTKTETVVYWNQQGAQGAQGAQGPQGATGKSGKDGATGPAGPPSLSSTVTFPNSATDSTYVFPLLGIASASTYTGPNIKATALHLPAACTAVNVNTTVYDAAGYTTALLVFYSLDQAGSLQGIASCGLTVSQGSTTASCSAAFTIDPSKRYGSFIQTGNGLVHFSNANVVIDTNCK